MERPEMDEMLLAADAHAEYEEALRREEAGEVKCPHCPHWNTQAELANHPARCFGCNRILRAEHRPAYPPCPTELPIVLRVGDIFRSTFYTRSGKVEVTNGWITSVELRECSPEKGGGHYFDITYHAAPGFEGSVNWGCKAVYHWHLLDRRGVSTECSASVNRKHFYHPTPTGPVCSCGARPPKSGAELLSELGCRWGVVVELLGHRERSTEVRTGGHGWMVGHPGYDPVH
jgi:hypothetical protein